MSGSRRWLALLPVTATLIVAWRAWSKAVDTTALSARQASGSSDVFWLVVTLTFANESDLATMETAWTPLARYCRDNEPNTLSYEMARSDKDKLKVRHRLGFPFAKGARVCRCPHRPLLVWRRVTDPPAIAGDCV